MKGQPFVLTLWLHGNIHPLAEDFVVILLTFERNIRDSFTASLTHSRYGSDCFAA